MKKLVMVGLVGAGLLLSGAATNLFAQSGNGNGRGYGGPPQSEEERLARQSACLEKNGGICPNGGPRAAGECRGQGQGKGGGKGGKGACDGTGPKGPNGKGPGPRAGQGR